MTNKEKLDYLHKWNRFQQKYEKYFEKKLYKALQMQVDVFIKTQDLMSIPAFPIYTTLVQLYKTVGPAWAKVVKMDGIKALDITGRMGFNEEIVALMLEYYGIDLLNDAEDINSYTRLVIGKILKRAANEGLSINEIVRVLKTDSELGPMRARRIARTETVTAANGAAMIYATKSGYEMEKVWLSVIDNRTRHNHKMIDGRTIPYEDAFMLGPGADIAMQQPGVRTQPNGLAVPASEVVNCRCTVAFQAKRDANGKIIRA
jgi:SPP1 gp7 family putative phage head morphogenesis protein